MDKAQLRRTLLNSLVAIPSELRDERSRRACRNLVSIKPFQEASTIMMFLSLPHEVDTAEAILHAWQLGKIVAVPKISWEQRHMIPVQINSLETGLATGVSGIRNPIAGVPVPFGEIDLVVTPGLGFDRRGNRLGRGGSYYDRFFTNPDVKAIRCGLGFDEQIVDDVPVVEHDQPVDFLVTDKEVVNCNNVKGE
ncbi:MAG: 5-formyltetrahydrofolate cyclo-ligase [Sedimentisphaerales bacterium]|nr:5-formyltetrahydrofolate cyclo-ligase [Sedimentisphaerales bacterium]